MEQGKVVLFIAMSLDGYISRKDDDISWLNMVDREGEDYGYKEFCTTVGSYIVGRKTYDKVMQMVGNFPPAEQFKAYILSRSLSGERDGVTFYNGDVLELVNRLKAGSSKNIYCDGGGEIVKLLMDNRLVDEYTISIIPHILGDGKRLFSGDTLEDKIVLVSV